MGHHCRMASLQIYWDTILSLAFRFPYRSEPFQKLITVGETDSWCIVIGGTLLSYWSNKVFLIFKSHLKALVEGFFRKLQGLFGTPAAKVGTGIESHLWWIEGFHDWSITVEDKLSKYQGSLHYSTKFFGGVKQCNMMQIYGKFWRIFPSCNGALLGLVI